MIPGSLFSIVIPTKNEATSITSVLQAIARQNCVSAATPIFLCDAHSTDATVQVALAMAASCNLNLTVTAGGLPPVGRNIGARLVETPYVLFLDADTVLGEDHTLETVLQIAETQALDLVVTHIRSRPGNLIDTVFWWLFSCAAWLKLKGPVAAGLFMFMRTETFWAVGGFNEHMLLGDDVELGRAIHPDRYAIAPTFVFTSNRRFQHYGYLRTFADYLAVFFSRQQRLRDHTPYFAVRYTNPSSTKDETPTT